MSAHPAAVDVAQFVRERFGHDLHPGFRDIIGGVAGRTGDALLRAGVDDRRWAFLADHVGGESLDPVDHAHEIDVDDAPPPGGIGEQSAPAPGPRIVHQDRDLAEGVEDRRLQALDILELAHVDSEGPDRVGTLSRLTQLGGGGLERLPVRIGHADIHAERDEFGRSGKADAARRAGDDRDPVLGKCRMSGHGFASSGPKGSRRLHHARQRFGNRRHSPMSSAARPLCAASAISRRSRHAWRSASRSAGRRLRRSASITSITGPDQSARHCDDGKICS